MSKIGKQPINIPDEIEVNIEDGVLLFKKGNQSAQLKILPHLEVEIKEKTLIFSPKAGFKQAISNWGTMRSLAANVVEGLTKDFEKILEIEGIGYRAALEGTTLVLSIGFSHQVRFEPPADIKIIIEKNTIKISGINKALVGETAARIRGFKKVEPYKGKGIRYRGEVVRRKAGKKVAGAGTAG